MKIVHVVLGKANPNRMNGVNKVVHHLASTQSQLGYKTEVWGITPTPRDMSDLPFRNFTTKLFQSNNHKLWLDKKLISHVKKENPKTIFHMHGGFIPEFFHLRNELNKSNIPFVITPHGCYNLKSMENSKVKKRTYFELFEKGLLKSAKALHCLGKSESQALSLMAPEVPTVVIPNGQELEDLVFQKQSLVKPDMPVFGFCGRMDKKMKGLDLLLTGFKQYLASSDQGGKLWLIGGGYDIEELKEMARALELGDSVVFFGPKFGDEKLNLLSLCDAFYHPSRYEGLPMSILEAAGLGLPCVVSDATNTTHYIESHNSGIVLEPNTVESVAESMQTINLWKQDGDKLEACGEAAKNMIKTAFSWEVIAEQFVEVYAA